jgi:hypothetical protein
MKMQMGRKQAKRERRRRMRRSEEDKEDKEDNASNHKSFAVVTANPNFRTLNTQRTGSLLRRSAHYKPEWPTHQWRDIIGGIWNGVLLIPARVIRSW